MGSEMNKFLVLLIVFLSAGWMTVCCVWMMWMCLRWFIAGQWRPWRRRGQWCGCWSVGGRPHPRPFWRWTCWKGPKVRRTSTICITSETRENINRAMCLLLKQGLDLASPEGLEINTSQETTAFILLRSLKEALPRKTDGCRLETAC